LFLVGKNLANSQKIQLVPRLCRECILGGSATSFYAQVADPPSMHSQADPAEPGNEFGRIMLNIN